MQPVRKVISATHFKPVPSADSADSSELTSSGKGKWTPCSPGDPAAVEKAWTELESDELVEPPLGMADFLKSVDQVRPTVTAADIVKHDEWTKESGECAWSKIEC
jgi:vacuolar protein-sorting-associated protein 4